MNLQFLLNSLDTKIINAINEGINSYFLLENKNKSNIYRKEKLTPELIEKYKNKKNMLIHLDEDSDGIMYFLKNKLIGYIGYKKKWIQGIWVNEKYRRENIGTKLLKYAIKHGAIYSSVNNNNLASINFHQKNGFVAYKEDDNMTYFRKKQKQKKIK